MLQAICTILYASKERSFSSGNTFDIFIPTCGQVHTINKTKTRMDLNTNAQRQDQPADESVFFRNKKGLNRYSS